MSFEPARLFVLSVLPVQACELCPAAKPAAESVFDDNAHAISPDVLENVDRLGETSDGFECERQLRGGVLSL